MGRMGGFLRGLDAYLQRADDADVCADAAAEVEACRDEQPEGDASDAAYDRTQGYTQPDPAHATAI